MNALLNRQVYCPCDERSVIFQTSLTCLILMISSNVKTLLTSSFVIKKKIVALIWFELYKEVLLSSVIIGI